MTVGGINGGSPYQVQNFTMNQSNMESQIRTVEDTGTDANTSNETDLQQKITEHAETVQEQTTRNREEGNAQDKDLAALHEQIKKSIDNYTSNMGNYEAKFGIHEATNRVTIKLVDKDTKKVIKELPPEKTLDMIAKCMEIAGILVDQKA